jgi:hypothetical protein
MRSPALLAKRRMRFLAGLGILPPLVAAAVLVATPAAVTRAAAQVPSCSTSSLVVWLNDLPGGGTAGSVYYELEFTNLSARACTLMGYPGVSALDLRGGRLGGGASREVTGRPRLVRIARGATAGAVLRVVDAGALASCKPAAAAGFKVYPPGQIISRVVPFPFQACAQSGHSNLLVRAIGSSGG